MSELESSLGDSRGNPEVRPQDYATGVSVASLVGLGGALLLKRPRLSAALAMTAVLADLSARMLSRRHPSPFPARFKAALIHPPREIDRVCRALLPAAGERILEIGPGTGAVAAGVVSAVGAHGMVAVLDIQPEMLVAVDDRAHQRGNDNVHSVVGDASRAVPFRDGAFDAAFMIGVLGELADRESALRDLFRVVKPGGRLLIGETFFLDPDYVPPASLCRQVERAGFSQVRRLGKPVSYLAKFRRPALPPVDRSGG